MQKTPSNPQPVPVTPPVSEATEKPKGEFTQITRTDLVRGKTMRIDKLYFKPDDAGITEESYQALNDLYAFLSENQDVVIEIGGHTNLNPVDTYCDSLSTARAEAVKGYLTEKGINQSRLQAKGYGKRKPLSTDRTAASRKLNQRVEIKIVDFSDK